MIPSNRSNDLGQAVGYELADYKKPELPGATALEGRFCRVELLDAERHGAQLFKANQLDTAGANWTYLPYGPFAALDDYLLWAKQAAAGSDPLFHAIIDAKTQQAVGVASLMRIDTANGVIEVGHINYSPLLQRNPAATEAMFLLMRRVFDELKYRRYEWKCDSLNAPSRAAARRLGFSFEGLFRQALVYKGRNRDTAWFSIVDYEWPAIKRGFENWLDPANFDNEGRQIGRLEQCIAKSRELAGLPRP